MQRTIKIPPRQTREMPVTVRAAVTPEGGGRPEYPLSFSSEAPVRRYDWFSGTEYMEVLSHKAEDIDLSRAVDGILPFLKSHERRDAIGSVASVALSGKELVGVARFSSNPLGQEAKTFVDEGDIRTVSVGYDVLSMTAAGKDKATGLPIYRCAWQPAEVSLEPVAADVSVGISASRSADSPGLTTFAIDSPDQDEPEPATPVSPNPTEGERSMSVAAGATPTSAGEPLAPAPAVSVGRDFAAEARQILDIFNSNAALIPNDKSPAQRAMEAIDAKQTPEQVGRAVLDLARTRAAAPTPSGAESQATGHPAKDMARYSHARAIRVALARKEGRAAEVNGLEAEFDQERRRSYEGPDRGGILVPLRARRTDEEQRAYENAMRVRTLGTDQSTGGQTLVVTDTMPDLIDVLRNRALIIASGARVFTGLSGIVTFMKKTAAASVTWTQQNPGSGVAATEPTFSSVQLSPKTLQGRIVYPRQLMVQANIDFEANLRDDLATGHALALDQAAITGTGSAYDPTGLYVAAGIPTFDFNGNPTNPGIVGMTTKLAKANNLQMGGSSFISEPALAGWLMSHVIEPGTPQMLWQGNHLRGTLAGWPAASTNQMPDNLGSSANQNGLIFGYWPDLAVGIWGNELEVVVDPYTLADKGQIAINTFSMADIAILRNESFCLAKGIVLS